MAEIWDLVDENGNDVGIKWSRADHDKIPEGLYHPCVEVWVRVGDRLLVARRHPDKTEGLNYDAPGGAMLSGESLTEAAARELAEEVGILTTEEKLEHLGVILGKVAYAVSYLLKLDTLPPLTLQPSEVVGYKLVSRKELDSMTDQLCDNCARRYIVYRDRLFK